MKRSLVLTAALSLAAVPLFSTLGSAQSTADRGYTVGVTAKTTPKRDRSGPYTFTTTGRIIPPPKFCAPGVIPNPGGNCVPVGCPQGTKNPAYCVKPGLGVICSGKVQVRYQKGGRTISARNYPVKPNCTYRGKTKFRAGQRSRRGTLKVRARFQGNQVLRPKASPTRKVRAG